MKSKAFIFFLLLTFVAMGNLLSQCDFLVGAAKKIDFEDYKFNGQENVGYAKIGEPVKLRTVFVGKNDYKLVLVGDSLNYDFRMKIMEKNGNVLWDNIDYSMAKEVDFTIENTKSLVIEVTPISKDQGKAGTYSESASSKDFKLAEGTCIGIFIGSRPSYIAGFSTRMNPKVAKQKVKERQR